MASGISAQHQEHRATNIIRKRGQKKDQPLIKRPKMAKGNNDMEVDEMWRLAQHLGASIKDKKGALVESRRLKRIQLLDGLES